jgi:hypothetical protein
MKKIKKLLSNAFLKSSLIKLMNAVVNPHPGHVMPNIDFHKQGIQTSISVIAFSNVESKK